MSLARSLPLALAPDNGPETDRQMFGLVPGRKARRWTAAEDALLATDTDAAVADRIGVSKATVATRRRLLGIEPYRPCRPRHEWTVRQTAMLGLARDTDVAHRLGVTRSQVAYRRTRLGIPSYRRSRVGDDLLGHLPDNKLAALLGVGWWVVAQRRRRAGIRSYRRAQRDVESDNHKGAEQ